MNETVGPSAFEKVLDSLIDHLGLITPPGFTSSEALRDRFDARYV